MVFRRDRGEKLAAGSLGAILAGVGIHDVVVVGAGFAGVTAAR